MAMLHLWDVVKVKLDLVGMISVVLQTSVFAKYLNYSEESREVVSGAQLTIATTQDCQALANGYTSALAMVEVTIRVVVLACFALKQNPGAWWAVASMPLIMLVVTACRMPIVLKVNADVGEYASDFHAYVAETVANYSVVQDYFQRPRMNEHYQRKSEALRVNQVPATLVEVNNKYCPKWLGPVFVGLYIAFESDAVFKGEVSLGKFLATVSILTDMAQDFAGIYELLMTISGTFDEVKSVVEILNMKTDVPSWLNVSRKRLNWTNQSRKTIRATIKPNGLAHWAQQLDSKHPRPEPNAVDTIVFELHDVSFHYNESPVLFQGVNLSAEQGNLIAYRAPLGTGLGTFMELLAHKKFPTSGTIFFPAHLRILFVSQEVYILSLSCWDNLTFGVEEDDIDPNVIDYILKEMHMEKTRALCQSKLRAFSKHKPSVSAEHARADECQHETEEEALVRLNNTEKAKIHLARAFIMNPEVMVLNRPCCHCDSQTVETSNTLRLMREMIDTRGVGMSPATIHRRRPRTAFFTPETDSQAEIADIVWEYDTVTRTINARRQSARSRTNSKAEGYRAASNASYGGNPRLSRGQC
jgi:ABC-type multidrug transport system fused ATPase/permease subunit